MYKVNSICNYLFPRNFVTSANLKRTHYYLTILLRQVFFLFAVSIVLTLVSAAEELIDTRESEDLTLKCRFSEQHSTKEFSYYWARSAGANFENVAIGNIQLNTNYR